MVGSAPVFDPGLILPLFLLQGLLQLARLKVNLHVSLLDYGLAVNFAILILDVGLQLHERINIVLQPAHHMLLEQQVVRRRQMVVLVIAYAGKETFLVELLLCHEVTDNLLIEQVWSLRDRVLLAVLHDVRWQ